MPTLNVTVVNKIATGDRQIIVCDNTDYTVHFELDAEWNDYNAKTMRVLYTNGNYDDIVFTGTDCDLPRIYNAQSIRIGIYAGDLHATAAAVYECKKSVLSDEGQHVDPPEDVYNQIMDAINSGVMDGVGIDNILKTATVGLVDTYTITYTDGTTTTFDITNGAQGTSITNIAKTSTSGNVDTYTITMSNGDTYTFTVTNGSVTSVDGQTGDVTLDNKAEIDGYYDGLTSGTANQLLSDKTVTDNAPCVLRSSGGGNHIGDRKEIKEVVGASVVWNQLVDGSFEDNTWWAKGSNVTSFTVSNNEATVVTSSGTSNYFLQKGNFSLKANHKYFISCEGKLATASTTAILRTFTYRSGGGTAKFYLGTPATTDWTRLQSVVTSDEDTSVYLRFGINDTAIDSYTYYLRNIIFVDLTPTSSAIADRAYALEQATAGSGVAWLKSYGFFTKPSYAYAEPSIQSVKVSAHETVGFNQWDEEWEVGSIHPTYGTLITSSQYIRSKNFCRCLPNTEYCISNTNDTSKYLLVMWYDGNKNYIGYSNNNVTGHIRTSPVNACYFKVRSNNADDYTSYLGGWCVNLHGDRDGEYEAYQKNTYTFDSTKTLNGILKLDANNNIYADGDTCEADGTVTRRYGIVDLGTLTWTYDSTQKWFSAALSLAKKDTDSYVANIVSAMYLPSSRTYMSNNLDENGLISINSIGNLLVRNLTYTDAATFKTAMSGVKLLYEVATPTTETADAYQQIMAVDPEGTERWVDKAYEDGDRDFEMPVGHITEYHADLKAKVEDMPDGPSSDGDYLLRRRNGVNTYVRFVSELPAEPTEDGVYALTATVSGGVATYSWEA